MSYQGETWANAVNAFGLEARGFARPNRGLGFYQGGTQADEIIAVGLEARGFAAPSRGLGGLGARQFSSPEAEAFSLHAGHVKAGDFSMLPDARAAFASLSPDEKLEWQVTMDQLEGIVAGDVAARADAAAASRLRASVEEQIRKGDAFTNPQEECIGKQLPTLQWWVPQSMYGIVCDTAGKPKRFSYWDLIPLWGKIAVGVVTVAAAGPPIARGLGYLLGRRDR